MLYYSNQIKVRNNNKERKKKKKKKVHFGAFKKDSAAPVERGGNGRAMGGLDAIDHLSCFFELPGISGLREKFLTLLLTLPVGQRERVGSH